jgi:hypothetical protein
MGQLLLVNTIDTVIIPLHLKGHKMKKIGFKGTLLELFEHCHKFGPNTVEILNYDGWISAQLGIANNILPIRKFAPHQRCTVIANNNMNFLAVDNEPLAWLTENAATKMPSLRDLITTKRMPISWNVRSSPGFVYKASGVATRFRDEGLKLAHIENAGMLAVKPVHDLTERFLRSLLLSNVFLFPSPRVFDITLSNLPAGVTIDQKRPEEDDYVRSLAKSWLESKLKGHQSSWNSSLTPELQTISNWSKLTSTILVEIRPKSGRGSTPQAAPSRPNVSPVANSAKAKCAPCPKRTKGNAVDIATAVDILKTWRLQCPHAVRLDCGPPPARNPKPWLHFMVDGYIDCKDDFTTTTTKQLIKGSQYNGKVHFNGDATCEAIDRFLAAYDACGQYQDILKPSATYEYKTLPVGQNQNRKFALSGFNGVEGFYLYHD